LRRETSAGQPPILVIEDDPPIAAGIVRGLSHAGFSVELATDGERGAALGLAEEFARSAGTPSCSTSTPAPCRSAPPRSR